MAKKQIQTTKQKSHTEVQYCPLQIFFLGGHHTVFPWLCAGNPSSQCLGNSGAKDQTLISHAQPTCCTISLAPPGFAFKNKRPISSMTEKEKHFKQGNGEAGAVRRKRRWERHSQQVWRGNLALLLLLEPHDSSNPKPRSSSKDLRSETPEL